MNQKIVPNATASQAMRHEEQDASPRCARCKRPGGYAYSFGGEVLEGEISGYLCLDCGGAVKRFIGGGQGERFAAGQRTE